MARMSPGNGPGAVEAAAAVLSIAWVVVSLLWLWGDADGGGMGRLLWLAASMVPVMLIWVAVALVRSARVLRSEAADLKAALEGLRAARAAGDAPRSTSAAPDPVPLERRLDELLETQLRLEAALADLLAAQMAPADVETGFAEPRADFAGPPSAPRVAAPTTPRSAPPPAGPTGPPRRPPPSDAQPRLALVGAGHDVEDEVSLGDFLSALNFPDTMEDADGFRALRAALADPRAARVIRAAQDVLTLISEDGIYMDDLSPDRARPELWRRFAQGERGGAIADLGGVRDPASLNRTAVRMREDPVFRDVAHHFLRHFDRMLEALEPRLSDADLARLSQTRSARVFMLLGRVAGIFG